MVQKRTDIDAHNKLQRQYYEEREHSANRRMHPVRSLYIANHIEKFLYFSALRKEETILDIGCGMGKYTLPLAERGYRVEGLDLSQFLLRELETHCGRGIEIPTHCADILDVPTDLEGRFDVVTGFFMLHHLIDVTAALREVRKLLKNGGRAFFLDVNPLCPLYYVQIALTPSMSWRAEKGILHLTPNKLRAAFSTAGFIQYRTEKFGILPPALRNTTAGNKFETAYDRLGLLKPVSAFQWISATSR